MERPLDDRRLMALLESTAREIELPPTPDISERVIERLAGAPERERRGESAPWFARPALATAVLVVLIAGTLVASSSARRAVADLLGVFGIEVEFGDAPVEAPEKPLDELDLGRAVTATEAAEAAGFEPRGTDALDNPHTVFFDPEVGATGMISTLYEDDILITEFRATIVEGFVKKVVSDGSTQVRYPQVGGTQGYWLTGAPHFFAYEAADGSLREESIRLAGNVLLWSSDGITYRIEGAGSLRGALKIAQRMGG